MAKLSCIAERSSLIGPPRSIPGSALTGGPCVTAKVYPTGVSVNGRKFRLVSSLEEDTP